MTDSVVPKNTNTCISSKETVANGDSVTTVTKTKMVWKKLR